MRTVRSAILHSAAGKYLIKVISLISTIAIARLLTPEEIGTFAIASALVMIMADFRMLGANTYLVREKELTKAKIQASYGLTILVSWSLGALIMLSSFWVSDFFEVENLGIIFFMLSTGFVLAPFISIPNALLSREYQFDRISLIAITAACLQLVSTIGLILLGFSYYALAIGHIVSVVTTFCLGMYATRQQSLVWPAFSQMKPIASLGIYTTLGKTLRNMQLTAPDVIIGKLGSTAQVAMFSRGLGFINFVTDSIYAGVRPVVQPFLSKKKNAGADLAQAYTHASHMLLGIILPVLSVTSVVTLPAIRIMFGEQWLEAATPASILAIWAMFRAIHLLSPQALIANHAEKIMFYKELIVFSLFVVLVIQAFPYGLTMIAWAFVVTGVLDLLLSSLALRAYLGLSLRAFYRAISPAFLIAVLCWGFVTLVDLWRPVAEQSLPFILVLLLLVVPLVWLMLVFVCRHPVSAEIQRLLARG
ncbi:oligosaccharide flippase family protein [Alkalimonas delamerensis]|uniref:Oligosaccharide flippase family protein n=1 Tax=Alkalimonas delamerensis TaxID=265981 RepID=A0ABT9GMD6_9GAMM|nr:oligosaccharide flippase family protein [Alkalimonas delamerensis]MDP4528122.1 oligosaccharide flippase family protein [Alkalimonas delamerensis]